MPRLFSAAALAFVALALGGCPTTSDPPPKQRNAPRPDDEWDGIQRTAEWLFATRDFSGKRLDECVAVLKWVRGEAKCKGSLCVHARDLTREWQARCPKLADKGEVEHDDVKELLETFETRTKESPTPCGSEAENILKNGCGKDKTCQATAEAWATRCGKSDGTPLVVRMLERTIERKLPEPKRVTLDTRSCDELGGDVIEGTKCKDTFACEESMKRLTTYRARCEADGARPTALLAAYELAVLKLAGQPATPIPVLPAGATVSPKDAPTALADGLGVVLWVCDQRVSDLEGYLAARRSCQSGTLVYAGIAKEQGDPKARLGTLELSSDAALLARLPSMVVAGEAELREKQAIAALGPELDRIAAAKAPAESIAALMKALLPHRTLLRKSAAVRKALGDRDEALAPVFRELGKRKQEAAKGKLDRASLLGLISRAKERLLADVSEAGAVEAGGPAPLGWLATDGLLPKSTAAMAEGMKNALRLGPTLRVDARTAKMAKAYADEQAQGCGAAYKVLQEARVGLVKCSLGLETCDEARVQAVGKQSDEARTKVDESRHQLDLVMSGPGASVRGDVIDAMNSAGCVEPWW